MRRKQWWYSCRGTGCRPRSSRPGRYERQERCVAVRFDPFSSFKRVHRLGVQRSSDAVSPTEFSPWRNGGGDDDDDGGSWSCEVGQGCIIIIIHRCAVVRGSFSSEPPPHAMVLRIAKCAGWLYFETFLRTQSMMRARIFTISIENIVQLRLNHLEILEISARTYSR